MQRSDDRLTVLLTGISGFVGHHVFEHIMKTTDWHVVGIASWQHRGRWDRLSTLDEWSTWCDRLTLMHHDLRAPFTESEIARYGLRNVDVILNVASESHVDRSITDPETFVRNNVDLQLNVLGLARHLRPKLFLQFSTDEVYGPVRQNTLSKEWDAIVPSNPYAASKAAQESLSVAYWRTYGVPVVVTNTMNVIGERQDPEKFLPMVIRRLLHGETIYVHGDSDGVPGSRFYVHARNVADALVFLVDEYAEQWPVSVPHYPRDERPDRWNIVGECEVRNDELVGIVASTLDDLGVPYPTPDVKHVDFHSSRPGHDLRYALDGERLRGAGWLPPVNLANSIRRTVMWYLEHPEWLEDDDTIVRPLEP